MVRDVFRLAKENAPAIIFIDEIDAIATKRFDAQTGGKLISQASSFAPSLTHSISLQISVYNCLDGAFGGELNPVTQLLSLLKRELVHFTFECKMMKWLFVLSSFNYQRYVFCDFQEL